MTYADFEYYQEYLCGREAVVPEAEFGYWEKAARREIDLVTFDRIPRRDVLPEAVRECTCELAELLYKADRLDRQALADGAPGVLTSYSNDGQSGTFDTSQSVYTADGKQAEIRRIIRRYLLNTGLMYKGVMEGE